MAEITVLGAGGWGLALALTAYRSGHKVNVWTKFEEEAISLRRDEEHKKLLPGVYIPKDINITTDLNVIKNSEMVIIAVPSFAVEQTAKDISGVISPETIITNVAKGFADDEGTRLSEIIKKYNQNNPVTVLSGPTHAEEVAHNKPCSIVSACEDIEYAERVQNLLMSETFRVYVNTDVIGVELCGAFKNVMALAAGVCDGMGFGDNTKAAMMTRGLYEMSVIGEAFGAERTTYYGLAGIGDLIVTCGSMHSRNRRAGILIGEGMSADEAVKRIGTVEGYFATKSAYLISKKVGVDMPITEQCYKVCYEGADPKDAIKQLMGRSGKAEQ